MTGLGRLQVTSGARNLELSIRSISSDIFINDLVGLETRDGRYCSVILCDL